MDDFDFTPQRKKPRSSLTPIKKGPRPAKTVEEVYQYGIWWLSQREHAEAEIAEKLHRKTDNEEWIAQTMQKLLTNNYINDQRYAEMWVHSHAHRVSARDIEQKLRLKKIDSSIIAAAIAENIQEEDQLALAETILRKNQKKMGNQKLRMLMVQAQIPTSIIQSLLENEEDDELSEHRKALEMLNTKQKHPIELTDRKQLDKLTRFLISRGFSYDCVKFAIKHHLNDPNDDFFD
jgi:regulatory protein